jgi:hypothetical protein
VTICAEYGTLKILRQYDEENEQPQHEGRTNPLEGGTELGNRIIIILQSNNILFKS